MIKTKAPHRKALKIRVRIADNKPEENILTDKEDYMMKTIVFDKKKLMALALVFIMLLTPLALISCQSGEPGADGKDGADGTAWLTGTETPVASQGKDGDLYFDTDSYLLYQKANGTWSILQSNFGKPGENGIDGATPSVTINADGYWVINDTVTNVKALGTNGTTPTISIDNNGYWVVNGIPTGVKAQGTNGTTPTIAINAEGYWVINGVPSGVKAEGITPTVTINEDGYWVINNAATDVKAKALDVTVAATAPTSPKKSDLFLNNVTWELFQYNGTTWVSKGTIGSAQSELKVVDLVIFMGQSNMAGRGVAAQAPVVQEGHGYEFRAVSDPTKLYTISEPFGVNENRGVLSENSKTGSLVSAFAESYYSYTGVPIVGVSAAQGGKSIDFWATGGDALTETINRYNAAKTYLTSNGYTVRHQYMVWLQGESDGKSGMSGDAYKVKLENLFGEMQEQGVEKAMVIRIGTRNYSDTVHDDIIEAQTELCRTHDDFVLINGMLASVTGDAMKDEAHYLQPTYNMVGNDAGKNMAYYTNTGMEPYFWDAKYNNFYPFGGNGSASEVIPPAQTTSQLIIDVADTGSTYDFSALGTVANGAVTVSTNNTEKYLTPSDTVILSDDYSWTCEIIAGKFTSSGGVVACSGTDGSGFIALPYKDGDVAISDKTAGFRFRDEARTFQIDMEMPASYDKDTLHHFAIVYDATTKTFKAYIDYVECTVVYTTGSQGSAFSDTQLSRVFGGYPTTSNAKCDFAYFAFNKKAMTVSEMKAMPQTTPDPIVVSVADATHDFSDYGTVSGDKLTFNLTSGTDTELKLTDAPVLTDDADWTVEIVVGNLNAGNGMFANAGVSGSGFITVPSYLPASVGGGAQFRFRDAGNTFQIDVALPADYDPQAKHHFALTYDAETKTFKAYVDKAECTITYTTGSASNVVFNDTELCNLFGGYSSTQFMKGDFYYFAFHYETLETSEMYAFPAT